MIIAAPPRTFFQDVNHMVMMKGEWKALLLTAAMSWAIQMLQNNWIADEFDYSIGGVSLNLEKSSKYSDMSKA